ncbi:uncharacterized protein LOC135361828 [Mirounga angustirostris]|uniref:uncharacterized protein LOC135361828 n=1 Tax=Mirounga angustirostris TaxID=9716 RepID=UPI00313D971C
MRAPFLPGGFLGSGWALSLEGWKAAVGPFPDDESAPCRTWLCLRLRPPSTTFTPLLRIPPPVPAQPPPAPPTAATPKTCTWAAGVWALSPGGQESSSKQPSSTQRHILSSQRGRGFWGQRQRGRDGVKFCGHIEGPVSLVSGRELQQGRYLAWRLGHSSSQAGVAYKIKSCPRHPIPCQCGQEKRNLKKPFSSEGRVPVASPPEECLRKFCTALMSLCKSSYTLEFSGFLRSQGFSLCPQDGLWQQRASPGAGSQLSKAVPDHDHGPWAQTAGARPAHRHTPSGASAQAPVSVGFQEDTHAHMHG